MAWSSGVYDRIDTVTLHCARSVLQWVTILGT